MTILYIERESQKECEEKIYGGFFIRFLYGKSWMARFFFLPLFSRCTFFSWLYGAVQKSRLSKFKVLRFIKKFGVDDSEFLENPSSFQCFNDFFIRKLKREARPIFGGDDRAVLPADARYLVYENIAASQGYWVKGHKFTLEELLQDRTLAHKYHQGTLVLARLAPVDYHRFHFPVDCRAAVPQEIAGPLYSVNPIALKTNIHILSRNKRVITALHTERFGTVLYIEIGATYVGTIHQTFDPSLSQKKGDEKGYFSFGGSSLILLFEPFRIQLDHDLIATSHQRLETLGKLGQSLGRAIQ